VVDQRLPTAGASPLAFPAGSSVPDIGYSVSECEHRQGCPGPGL